MSSERIRCPILDTWWQTETGMHMITTMIGEPMRPGFAGKPIPGIEADVVDKDGKSVKPGTGGLLVIKSPWPSMLRTVYKDDERYRKYWDTIKGVLCGRRSCSKRKGRLYHDPRPCR